MKSLSAAFCLSTFYLAQAKFYVMLDRYAKPIIQLLVLQRLHIGCLRSFSVKSKNRRSLSKNSAQNNNMEENGNPLVFLAFFKEG